MIQLELKDLCIGYNFKPVQKNINCKIEYGDFLCIVGTNGVGKSTLIKTILGLFNPISGKIIYEKRTKLSSIGYLQQSLNLANDFPASVYEVVLSGCLARIKKRPFYGKKEKELVQKNLEILDIENIKSKPFKELSGGQQQRVLIARALCAANKMIILDEPFVGLDIYMVKQLKDTIRRINKELGVTIIMVTHHLDLSIEDVTKVLELSTHGPFFGSVKEYQSYRKMKEE